ncbi:MAG TPA: SCO family protein [Flavipsychrobacter sp.]
MTNNKKNKTYLLGFLIAVLVPLSFYLITAVTSKGLLHLPKHYVADSVVTNADGTKDTVWHRVEDVVLTDQFGDKISLNKDYKGKILLVNFIFTNCPSVCPRLTSNMKDLQAAFKKDPKRDTGMDTLIQLVSVTVDPKRDSFPAMRAFADGYRINYKNWSFLTGPREDIYNFARKQLFVNMQEGTGGVEDLIHTQKIVLIDTSRYIRGYYDGLDTGALIQCAEDVVLLTKEKKRKKNK